MKLKHILLIHSIVLLATIAYVADQLSDGGEAAMSHMAVGTTSGGKTDASITLEVENTRNALSAGPTQGGGASDHQVTYQGIFTGIAATLVEWAVFNNVLVVLCSFMPKAATLWPHQIRYRLIGLYQ